MKPFPAFYLLSFFLLSSCAPATQVPTQTVSVYATSSAQPWLAEVYSCAGDLLVTVKIDLNEPDIYLRLGEPETIIFPMYKIGEEEILIVVNNASPVQNLSLTEAQDIFAHEQVWVFSSGEDVQRAFDQLVMHGRSVTSSANVAVSAQQMSMRVGAESSAIGILPKRWIASSEGAREVYSAGVVPVLAVTKQEPQAAVSGLIACLQGN